MLIVRIKTMMMAMMIGFRTTVFSVENYKQQPVSAASGMITIPDKTTVFSWTKLVCMSLLCQLLTHHPSPPWSNVIFTYFHGHPRIPTPKNGAGISEADHHSPTRCPQPIATHQSNLETRNHELGWYEPYLPSTWA